MRELAAALPAAAWLTAHATAPAVRGWRPATWPRRSAGPLDAGVLGARGDVPVVWLLHGMTGSSDAFGRPFDRLAERAVVVVPDLLGFGRSRAAPAPDGYGAAAHLAALSAARDALGLAGRPTVVAGHSMGGVLALLAAAEWPEAHIAVALCAPLYEGPAEADARIGAMGWFERLFVSGPVAERVCAWMCAHREAAALLAPVVSPRHPVPLARMGVQHTWRSYTGALDGLIRDAAWRPGLQRLAHRGADVWLVEGGRDDVPVPRRAGALAATHPNVRHLVHPDAGHDLPLSRPGWAARQIAAALQP